jgi:hypothetical protein
MSNELVSDADVGKALDYLRDSAVELGKATERASFTSSYTKHVKALEMKRFDGSAAAQEREAVAGDRYLEAINEEAVAAGEVAKARAYREAAMAKIDVWRTQSRNMRER